MRPTVVIGLLGLTKDHSSRPDRWDRWRPTVSIAQQPDLVIDRMELLTERKGQGLAKEVCADLASVSPETAVQVHQLYFRDPWDFAEVYQALLDWVDAYSFDPDNEDYLVHMTTGTHVVQICWFLLVETRRLPARLLQSSPSHNRRGGPMGSCKIIDLDLSRYDLLATRFEQERQDGISFLKAGIATRNPAFNQLIERIEEVALASVAPMLLTGPTGVGKTQLAGRIFELKQRSRRVSGSFVQVNCATLRGDGAMSTLFGHEQGAFTGAVHKRDGLLKAADGGLLFLDEIGELGLDEQAMLLRAIEEGIFMPLGADQAIRSSFQLIAGTNRNLRECVEDGTFREDLLARIDLWNFQLPSLRMRLEDLEPNLDYELAVFEQQAGRRVTFNKESRTKYLEFACSPSGRWNANFRDLSASVTRMATLARGGRITADLVSEEISRLKHSWEPIKKQTADLALELLGAERARELDRFDRVQLNDVLHVCREAKSLSSAGRELFAASLAKRTSQNDAARLSKYLARFGLHMDVIQNGLEHSG